MYSVFCKQQPQRLELGFNEQWESLKSLLASHSQFFPKDQKTLSTPGCISSITRMPPDKISVRPFSTSASGPSRLPYNPSGRTSWNITVDDEGHLDSPTANPGSKNLSKSTRRGRSVSFQPVDVPSSIRNSTRHRRKTSAESHLSLRLTSPIQTPTKSMTNGKGKGKVVLRRSLTGENALGMTINDRANILADVAGDCLVTLVKSALRAESANRRRSSVNDEVKKAWEGLYGKYSHNLGLRVVVDVTTLGIRQSYLFPPWSPPFPSYTDILRSLHSQIRDTLNAQALTRAIDLSNLATFVWTLSRPDEACQSFPSLDLDIDDEDEDAPRRNTRTKGDGKHDSELIKGVRMRNALLLIAWKKFWLIVVPAEKRTSDIALRLWLDFATQIALLYQQPSVEDPDLSRAILPTSPNTLLAELFSPSAVGRFGQWSISEDFDSQEYSEEKADAEERWRIIAQKRIDELAETDHAVLRRKYPFSEFRKEIIAHIQHEILASPITALLTPGRRQLLIGHSHVYEPPLLEYNEGSSSEAERDDTEIANWSEDTDEEKGEEGSEDTDRVAMGDDIPIDMDIFEFAAAELEAEEKAQQEREDHDHNSHDHTAPETHAKDMDEVDSQIPVLAEGVFLRSSSHETIDDEDSDDDGDWAVKDVDFAIPNNGQIGSGGQRQNGPRFDWTKRQEDAVQVTWESQSVDGHESPSSSSLRQTPVDARLLVDHVVSPITHDTPAYHAISPSNAMRLVTSPTPLRAERMSVASPSRSSRQTPKAINFEQSISLTSPLYVEESEEDEPVEDEENAILDHDNNEDILPSASQLNFVGLADGEASPPSVDGHDEDDEFADLLPTESQFAVGHTSTGTSSPHYNRNVEIVNHVDNDRDISEPDQAGNEETGLAQPGFHGSYISPRPRRTQDAHSFAPMDPDESLEDRRLLFQPSSSFRSMSRSREPTIKTEHEEDMLGLHGFINLLHPGGVRRQRGSSARYIRDEDDPFLHDEDGSPLEPDELCISPVEGYSNKRSTLFGKTSTSSSIYCRLTGKRKWTLEEELLLYRTVQKVPIQEEYPLRMVWDLYGEFGRFGKQLRWYNTQHMKDKLRTTVKRRQNEGRRVEGRVRAWAARGTREREEYEEELEEYKRYEQEEDEDEEEEDNEDIGTEDEAEGLQGNNANDQDEHEAIDADDGEEGGQPNGRAVNGHRAVKPVRYVEIDVDDDDFPAAVELDVDANVNDVHVRTNDDDFPGPANLLPDGQVDEPQTVDEIDDFPAAESLDIDHDHAFDGNHMTLDTRNDKGDDDDFPQPELPQAVEPDGDLPEASSLNDDDGRSGLQGSLDAPDTNKEDGDFPQPAILPGTSRDKSDNHIDDDFPPATELPLTSTAVEIIQLAGTSDRQVSDVHPNTNRYPSRGRKRTSTDIEDEAEANKPDKNKEQDGGQNRKRPKTVIPAVVTSVKVLPETSGHKRRSKETSQSRPSRPSIEYGKNRAARKVPEMALVPTARKTTSNPAQTARKSTNNYTTLRGTRQGKRSVQTARKTTNGNNRVIDEEDQDTDDNEDVVGANGLAVNGHQENVNGDDDLPEPEDNQMLQIGELGVNNSNRLRDGDKETTLDKHEQHKELEERRRRVERVVLGKTKRV
ncbi:hypothetical protein I204_03929 [Kwoniella mangroviensis CBS 8886]|nr:hypothetical protein I204_03929 [Kwoniella mangroviensis CBS 8886]